MASDLAQDALLPGHHLGAGALTRRAMAELVTAAEVLALADLGLVRPVLDSAGHASAVVPPCGADPR